MSSITCPREKVSATSLAGAVSPWTSVHWFLAIGLALRLLHFVLNHPIWYDEAVLLFNVLEKGYVRLLGPLDYAVAAPPFFLWTLRSMALVVGDHPFVWRLPPFIVGCLTLLLFGALARRVLKPQQATLVVALAAFSDAFIWLGCNVKPYILDAFIATAMLYFYVTTTDWPLARRLVVLLVAAPVVLCFSYPSLFLYVAYMGVFVPQLWRLKSGRAWGIFTALAGVVGATFVVLYLGPMRAQRVPGLIAEWQNKFVDWSHLATVPGWVLGNTFLVFHYCYNPIGAGCTFFVVLGVWWCVGAKHYDWIGICVGPIVVVLLAAFVRAYPYSNNRLIFFLSPGIGLMIGLGVGAVKEWLGGRIAWAQALPFVFLLTPEVVLCGIRLYAPWDQPDSPAMKHFVDSQRQDGDIIASDEGTFRYYYRGDVQPLAKVTANELPANQRVWVLFYGHPDAQCRKDVRYLFKPGEWEVKEETSFKKAYASLVVRRETRTGSRAPE